MSNSNYQALPEGDPRAGHPYAYNPYAQAPQPHYVEPQYSAHPQPQPPAYVPPQQAQYNNVAPVPLDTRHVKHPTDAPHANQHAPVDEAKAASRFPSSSYCRDAGWAIFFVLHIIAMCVTSGLMYHMYKDRLTTGDDNNNNNNDSIEAEVKMDKNAFGLLGIFIASAVVTSYIWLELFKIYSRPLIWICLLMSPFFAFVLGVVSFVYLDQPIMGVIFFLVALVNLIWIYFVRSRIEFAANVLSIASQVLKRYPATTLVAFFGVVVQFIWVIIWAIAAAGVMVSFHNQEKVNPDGSRTNENGPLGFTWFVLLISFFWTSQVLKNVTHCTTAGLVATWYFAEVDRMPENPTLRSFQRATWSSFGSICFGSLIIAVVKAMRAIVNQARDAEHPIARCIVLCILQCLERMIQYFNQYAFTEVAIYGKSYLQAASDTFDLLQSSGMWALINDDLVGAVLFFACFINGLVGAASGALLAKYVLIERMWGVWCFMGFILNFGLCAILMEVIGSAVIAVFVCYAEDPVRLAQTKPHVYEALNASMNSHRTKRPQIFARRN